MKSYYFSASCSLNLNHLNLLLPPPPPTTNLSEADEVDVLDELDGLDDDDDDDGLFLLWTIVPLLLLTFGFGLLLATALLATLPFLLTRILG